LANSRDWEPNQTAAKHENKRGINLKNNDRAVSKNSTLLAARDQNSAFSVQWFENI